LARQRPEWVKYRACYIVEPRLSCLHVKICALGSIVSGAVNGRLRLGAVGCLAKTPTFPAPGERRRAP
jgi:hypothetical protein